MIKIGNCIIGSGTNITINGRRVSGSDLSKPERYDSRKEEEAGSTEIIEIISPIADTNISVSDESKIKAHLYGEAATDEKVELDIFRIDQWYTKVVVNFEGHYCNGELTLDVVIPKKMFKRINFTGRSSSVFLKKGVAADTISVETISGSVKTYAECSSFFGRSTSGSLSSCIPAKRNVFVDMSCVSGSIHADFTDFGSVEATANTLVGSKSNRHMEKIGFIARAKLSTTAGNITIK